MNNCNCVRCAEYRLEGAESYLDMVLGSTLQDVQGMGYRQARINLVRAQEDLEWARYLACKSA